MTFLVAVVVDVTVILVAALAACPLLRRRSAALRHAVLASALAAAAVVPLLETMLPPWQLPLPASRSSIVRSSGVGFAPESGDTATATALPGVTVAAPPSIDWRNVAIATWAAGALVAFTGLALGLVRLRRMAARCMPVRSGCWHATADIVAREHAMRPVPLLQSPEGAMLVTWGLLHPKIVLPVGADAWTDDRRRIVLAHEFAHVRRGDWATQMMAESIRAILWFHPLAWIVCRRLRQESEYACDDAVIACGVDATEYATHLLDVARHAVGRRTLWAEAPAVAHPSTLERRIAAMLTAQRSREPLTRRSALFIAGAALAAAVPIAAASATAEQTRTTARADVTLPAAPSVASPAVSSPADPDNAPAVPRGDAPAAPSRAPVAIAAASTAATGPQETPSSISGTLYDPLGGLLPGVALTLTDTALGITYTGATDRNGSFSFPDLQPATYDLRAVLPGFRSVSTVMPIGPGAHLERRIVMPIGSLQETMTVVCSPAAAPAAPRPRAVLQPRPNAAVQSTGTAPFNGGIGGQIRVPRQISRANPVCPNQSGIDTVVILGARVGIDGYLSDINVLRHEEKAGQEVVDAAIEAVRLWQYTPTLLNGVPVEADIMMTVLFKW